MFFETRVISHPKELRFKLTEKDFKAIKIMVLELDCTIQDLMEKLCLDLIANYKKLD